MSEMQDEVFEETIKKEKDFSEQTKTQIEESRKLIANEGKKKLKEAVEALLALEKLTRLSGDAENNAKVNTEIVRLCADVGAWTELSEYITVIAKKRTLIKQSIAKMVNEAMTFIPHTPSKAEKIELINTLRRVSEGKIYVEVERARLVKMLAEIKELEGNIKEASELLQEVQIETVGSMDPKEKIAYILEQMRLCLDNKDYVRAQIISKKITPRSLADKDHQELKIQFYKLMNRYHTNNKDYLELCKAYYQIYDTPIVQEDTNQWSNALENMVIFVILSPFDNHQHDLMNRIWRDRKLEEKHLSVYRELLKSFVSSELIHWIEFEQKFGKILSQTQAFKESTERLDDFKKRIIENNIRIVAKYYSRITLKRLSELLSLDQSTTEDYISKMVTSKTISAKIDRLDGIVTFKRSEETSETLNNWSHDIVQLLSTVEKTLHLINSQYMVHGQQQKKSKGKK